MKTKTKIAALTLIIAVLTPSTSIAIDCPNPSPCQDLGLYALSVGGCPEYMPGVDTSVPLCRQGILQYAYLDKRCYKPIISNFDWKTPCYEWDCPVPYAGYQEPRSGCTYMDSEEADQHYRSVRELLGQVIKRKRR